MSIHPPDVREEIIHHTSHAPRLSKDELLSCRNLLAKCGQDAVFTCAVDGLASPPRPRAQGARVLACAEVLPPSASPTTGVTAGPHVADDVTVTSDEGAVFSPPVPPAMSIMEALEAPWSDWIDEELVAAGGAMHWMRLRDVLVARHPSASARTANVLGLRALASIPASYCSDTDDLVRLPHAMADERKEFSIGKPNTNEEVRLPT